MQDGSDPRQIKNMKRRKFIKNSVGFGMAIHPS